jgi:hypothetical protein
LTSLGTISAGTWNATKIDLAHGGTNGSLTASIGGIVWSDASQLQILSGTASANKMLLSGSNITPTWSAYTMPSTTAVNQLLYSSATDVVSGLSTATNGILVTDGSGVPSISTTPTLPSGTTATTKAYADNSTAIATTAFVQSALPAYARVTGSDDATTSTTLTDISDLSIALVTNALYEFEAVLSVQSSDGNGNQYGVNYTASGATVEAQISGTNTSIEARADRINALNAATPSYLTIGVNATGGIKIQGIITTSTNAGNLTIQHLKATSGISTVFKNSYLKVTRIQ